MTAKIGCVAVVTNFHGDMFLGLECNKGRGIILPGGKWQPGETFRETALRELYEETNTKGIYHRLLFAGMDESDYYCYAFRCAPNGYPEIGWKGPEGKVVWVNRRKLLQSAFKGYYELMFEALDKEPTL